MFAYYLELAWRRCRQNLPMVALLVLTMAIGIASCMTATTVFSALSGQPLPGISNHLYVVTMDARSTIDPDSDSYDVPQSLLNFRDAKALVDAHRARRQIALAISLTQVKAPGAKHSQQVIGYMGYGPLLSTLGVPLRSGRPWTRAELDSRAPVVIIASTLAETLFGTADAVGKSLQLGSQAFRVIGVTAPWKPRIQFLGITENSSNPLGQHMQFFVPARAALDAGVGPLSSGKCGKKAPIISYQSADISHCRWIETWVALDTPANVKAYGQFLDGFAQAQHASGRFAYPPKARLYGAMAWLDVNHLVPSDVDLNLMLASGFLLLCMINVAGLLAARFLRRQGDTAIRRALGATRSHVFAQHVVEAGLLGLMGGVLGLPLTLFGLWLVRMQPVAYAPAAQFSPAVFAGLVVLSLVVGIVVGILPAWRICRQPPATQIKVG